MATHPVARLLLWAALAYLALVGLMLVLFSVGAAASVVGVLLLIGVGVGAFKLRRQRPSVE